MNPVIIGSRGSDLALWQANFVMNELKKIGIAAEIKIIKTKGDKVQNLSFDKLEGKGFFTKELEDGLLANEIDLAVHSHKDLPTTSPEDLIIAAVSYREDPSEILLIHKDAVDGKQKFSLKKNAVVGTSSARRKSQIIAFRSDIELKDLRGNVPTRVQKLRNGEYDGILLAAAGLERLQLDMDGIHVEKINSKEFIPAPAQGVLAIQIRKNDKKLFEILQKINHKEVAETIAVERKVLNLFDGGCQLPLGAYCEKDEDSEIFRLWLSKAKSWDVPPVVMYLESKNADGFAELAVKKLNEIIPSEVMITRDIKRNDFLQRVLEANGYKFHGISLIEIKKIPLTPFKKTDWVFFSSKHAVRHFMDQKPELGAVKFGAVGKETAAELRKYDKRADFIGYSTDTKLTGKQFASVVQSGTVLFPLAKGSMRSIQQQFHSHQVSDVVVYETIKHDPSNLPKANILVFTSPSNVDAFFEKNKISADQKVIAMGQATGNALERKGVKRYKMPPAFDDVAIAQVVFSL
jgi:hydroxymethylbilane synthase